MVCFLIVSCEDGQDNIEEEIVVGKHPQKSVELSYAEGFSIDTIKGGFQRITVNDFLTDESVSFILVPKGIGFTYQGHEQIIQTPVEDLSIFSTSFIGFLQELDAMTTIKYIENVNYIYNEDVIRGFNEGQIQESGNFGQINLEKVLLNAPELMVINSFIDETNEDLIKLDKGGVPNVPCVEWQEKHPLARAEWIKFFGALLDKEKMADSLFSDIEARYYDVAERCEGDSLVPNVIFSAMYEGVWYIPGGESYVAQILKDAKGTYAWSGDESTASLSLTFENIAVKSLKNDVWINPEASSIGELTQKDKRYKKMLDYISLGVFQCMKRMRAQGGNDFWEYGVVRPDLVLRDYGKMLHPTLFESDEFTYFTKLE